MSLDYQKYLNKDDTQPEWLSEFIRCRKWIEDALEYSLGTHNVQDLLDDVATNELQLWSSDKAVIITQILVYPRKKLLHAPIVAGNLEGVAEMTPSVIEFAKFIECQGITTAGRKGWERTFLREYNFKPAYNCMLMEI